MSRLSLEEVKARIHMKRGSNRCSAPTQRALPLTSLSRASPLTGVFGRREFSLAEPHHLPAHIPAEIQAPPLTSLPRTLAINQTTHRRFA